MQLPVALQVSCASQPPLMATPVQTVPAVLKVQSALQHEAAVPFTPEPSSHSSPSAISSMPLPQDAVQPVPPIEPGTPSPRYPVGQSQE